MKFLRKLFGFKEPANSEPLTQTTGNNKPVAATGSSTTLEELLDQLKPVQRTAYIPITEVVPSAFSNHSKIGGYPYLTADHPWPGCPNCGQHMQLFLQLNMAELPAQKEDGLVQLFYCTNMEPVCEIDTEAWQAFSKGVVCRRVDACQPASATTVPTIAELFPEKRIIGWSAIEDYPSFDELEDLGVSIDIDDYELLEEAEKGIPASGDKLFGWPYWVQSVDYPYDRTTGSQMELLFQLDSEVNLPYIFGDVGVGHLTRSKDNPGELAFGWACH